MESGGIGGLRGAALMIQNKRSIVKEGVNLALQRSGRGAERGKKKEERESGNWKLESSAAKRPFPLHAVNSG